MKRREFVKTSAASLLLSPFLINRSTHLYADSYASPIVSVYDQKAAKIDFESGSKPNYDDVIVDRILSSQVNYIRVMRMVDTAVMKITGQTSLGKAWESLFPDGHPNMHTKIGIKLNFSYGDRKNDEENNWSKMNCPFGPKAAITNAIVTGMTRMLDGNFPPENITLVERMYSIGMRKYYPLIQGYRPVSLNKQGLYKNETPGACGMHWIFPRKPAEIPEGSPKFIAAPDFKGEYRAPQRIYAGIYKNDFLINYAISKDHRASGITGAMKNNYGCTDNPMGTHGSRWNDENSPYAGTKRCIPVFQKYIQKESPYILNVLDALTTVYEGGPLSGKVYQTNTIAVSRDPVAIDAYELQLINKVRKEKGFSVLGASGDRASDGHKNASFLQIASEKYALGSMSMDDLHTYDLTSLKEDSMIIPAQVKMQSRIGGLQMAKNGYEIMVYLDESKRKHVVESRIEDLKGNVVKTMKTVSTRSPSVALGWDHKNNNKSTVKMGFYVWYITVDGMLHSATIVDGV
jgi:hypothetical protein